MPAITLSFDQNGPIISVFIGISLPRIQAMRSVNVTPAPPALGKFLIDTGASSTCVDPELIDGLGLPMIGQVPIMTPSTNGEQHFCDQFDCSLLMPGREGAAGFHIPAMPIITTHLRSQGIDGLIGRDVLRLCTLTYIGSAGIYSLGF